MIVDDNQSCQPEVIIVMRPKSFNFLKTMVEAPSPSGYEMPAVRIFCEYIQPYADEVSIDVMGNASALLSGKAPGPRVMISGHCDEIGFMVQYIDDQGFIYFSCIGGIDLHLIPGHRVQIHTENGPILGVIGRKPIHLMEDEERKKVSKITDLFIDIGAHHKKDVENHVHIGDPITIDIGLKKLKNNMVSSRALDDKVGSFVVAETLRLVKERGCPFNGQLISVATVQEEIGIRGATTSAYRHQPDVGIAIDVGFATDQPGIEKKKVGDISVGKGPIIARGANINPVVFDLLIKTAEQIQLPYQIVGAPRSTGTDANVMQLSRSGVAAALLSVPCRYMHTPVEIVSTKDLENTALLLSSFICNLSADMSFIPS
ncbi:MAG: M42 family metallopeptidase [bacterium]